MSYQEKYRCLFFYPKRKTVSIHRSDAYLRFYQDFVDKLREVFNKLELIMEGEPAIYLSDPVWRACALSLWDTDRDGYITEEEANVGRLIRFNEFTDADKIQILDLSNLAIWTSDGWKNLTGVKEVYFGKKTGMTKLFYQCFMNNTSIELLDIGESILETERMVCYGATNLKKVVLNNVLTRIDGMAFRDCISLTEISDIPDTCTGIYGDYNAESFRNCSSLKKLVVGAGIQKIGGSTFRDCTSMESFYIKATTPPAMGDNCFTNNPCNIYVPHASVDAYKAATNWSQYASRIYGYDF